MFERFTERARQVVVLAKEEAANRHHAHVSLPHLVKGLIREEGGLAAQVLDHLNVQVSYVGLPAWADKKDEQADPPFSAQAKLALDYALREALSLGHNYIGTEHILLGILRIPEQEVISDAEAARAEVLRMLSGPGPRKAKAAAPKPPEEESCDVVQTLHDLVDISVGFVAGVRLLLDAIR